MFRAISLRVKSRLSVPGNGAHRAVGYWMLATSGAVLGIMVLGGLTRLTESGLSMMDWKLVHFLPPQTEAEWREYFERYRLTPEGRMNNSGMTMEEYKRIYWWEHVHRVYGRVLGLAVMLPSAFFTMDPGWATLKYKRVMAMCSGLVVAQGLLGWYMVKSGLDEENVRKQQAARVSAYRLAAHLGSAVLLYSTLFYSGLSITLPKTMYTKDVPLKCLARGAKAITALLSLTMLTGVFVAGLDAGMIYNTFPKMGDRWLPSDVYDDRKGVRNATENPTAAQFNHRIMATETVGAVSAYCWWARRYRAALPKRVRMALDALVLVSWGQGFLGVATLLCSVPVPLASAHQTGAMAVLSTSLYLVNILRPV